MSVAENYIIRAIDREDVDFEHLEKPSTDALVCPNPYSISQVTLAIPVGSATRLTLVICNADVDQKPTENLSRRIFKSLQLRINTNISKNISTECNLKVNFWKRTVGSLK